MRYRTEPRRARTMSQLSVGLWLICALSVWGCDSEEEGLVPMQAAGTTAGMTAGDTAAGMTGAGMTGAGMTAAGMTGAGMTGAGMTAGATTGGEGMAGTSVVPPMDDAGRCFEGCLNLFSCPETALLTCGKASLAAFAATCQTQCVSNAAGINAATAAGCGAEANVLSALGLTCDDDSLCAEADCMGGTCSAGQCNPFTCAPDVYDAEGNDAQDRATSVTFEPLVASGLSLCNGDRDWYVVEIPAGASMRVDFGFQHRQADVDVKAYDGEGNVILTSASGNDNERLSFTPDAESARRVWIEVYVFAPGTGAMDPEMPVEVRSAEYQMYISTNLPAPICANTSDCGEDLCVRDLGICLPPPPCLNDDECFGGVCDIPTGRCIDCYTNEDCASGVCDTSDNTCVTCLTNIDCAESSVGSICNPEGQTCVECVTDNECVDGTCSDRNRCIPNSCNDPQEPDNDLMSATTLMFNGTTAEANGYSCGDDDFFTFNTTGGENVLISALFTDEVGDVEMEVIDPLGTSFRRTTSTDNELFGFPNAPAGQFTVRVYSFNFQINQYTLRVDLNSPDPVCHTDEQCNGGSCDSLETSICLPAGYCESNRDCAGTDEPLCDMMNNRCKSCNPDTFEPNNDQGSAIPHDLAGGTLNTCGGPDFFSVEVAAGRTLNVTVSFSHMSGDIDVRVFNQAMEQVATSAGTSDMEELSYLSEMDGVYFIEVYGFRDVYNEYTLSVSVQ